MKPLLALTCGFFLISGAYSAQAAEEPPHTIALEGHAQQEMAPDQAILSLSIVTTDRDLIKAKQQNDVLADKLTGIAKKYDIAKEKIAMLSVNMAREDSFNQKTQKEEFLDYKVTRSYQVTIDKLDTQEKILGDIINAGMNQINGVQFQLSDMDGVTQKLRVKAFENAKASAQAVAQAAGVKLGTPISISIGGAQYANPARPMIMAGMSNAMKSPEAPPTMPGLISLSADVNVVFTLQ